MNKKLIMIVMAVLILLVMSVTVYAFPFFDDEGETFTVGNCTFDMPEGYSLNGTNKFCATAITDGENTIFILEQNSSNVNKYIKEYENQIKEKNESMKIQNMTIDDMKIYKTDNKDNPNTVHYWFVKGKNTYDIYKWDNNKKMDSIVIDLIGSIH